MLKGKNFAQFSKRQNKDSYWEKEGKKRQELKDFKN